MTAPDPNPTVPQPASSSKVAPGPAVPPRGPKAGVGGTPPQTGPGTDAASPRRSPGTRLALAASVLALIVAFSSALFSWRAIDQAKDAKDIALGRALPPVSGSTPTPGTRSAGNPTGGATSDATIGSTPGEETTELVDPNSTDAPELGERTVYKPYKTEKDLVLNADCNYSRYVDIDEPRVDVPQQGHDLKFTMGCNGNTSYLSLGPGVKGSTAVGPEVEPAECSDKIRTAPLADATVPVRKATVLCVITDYFAARAKGDQWRLAMIKITGVAVDGVTNIELRSFDIINP